MTKPCQHIKTIALFLGFGLGCVWAQAASDTPVGAPHASALPQNRFVYTQVKFQGDWDPYPTVWEGISQFLEGSTSIQPWPQKRMIDLNDPLLYESPFLVLMGSGRVSFSKKELTNLQWYLSGGGFLLIDNSEAQKNNPFEQYTRQILLQLFPDSEWKNIPFDHAVFRSFFLLRRPAGRRQADTHLKGLWLQGRLAVVYSANDLHGAWVRDPLGQYLYACEPGGEWQRKQAFKLTLNVVMFSLTGTYKTDAVHQRMIKRKLKRAP